MVPYSQVVVITAGQKVHEVESYLAKVKGVGL